ncbi:hypothetical protein A4R44_02808 [Amycolatopsis sp. M39]|nr:hypothetical protein A4R44_02808 [Amycolatopsis sp. M39]
MGVGRPAARLYSTFEVQSAIELPLLSATFLPSTRIWQLIWLVTPALAVSAVSERTGLPPS